MFSIYNSSSSSQVSFSSFSSFLLLLTLPFPPFFSVFIFLLLFAPRLHYLHCSPFSLPPALLGFLLPHSLLSQLVLPLLSTAFLNISLHYCSKSLLSALFSIFTSSSFSLVSFLLPHSVSSSFYYILLSFFVSAFFFIIFLVFIIFLSLLFHFLLLFYAFFFLILIPLHSTAFLNIFLHYFPSLHYLHCSPYSLPPSPLSFHLPYSFHNWFLFLLFFSPSSYYISLIFHVFILFFVLCVFLLLFSAFIFLILHFFPSFSPSFSVFFFFPRFHYIHWSPFSLSLLLSLYLPSSLPSSSF